ncbi:MAG: tripartite tricarboxylate transporter TctB family protein [Pseudorhodoplanes sp.]|nr:tripartite tricarboxylate transporter TctB family protein [Pseudorhodoplanes sp.]
MRLPDRATGLFLVGLGGLAAYGGSLLPPVPGQQVGPNVFPMVVGTGLVLCGVMIALGIGRHFEDEAEADLAMIEGGAAAPEETRPLYRLRVLLPPALLLFYVYAVERIGFIPTAAAVVFVAALALGARLKLAIPLALLAPVAVHLVFYKLLRVPLAAGYLPMPW